MSSLLYNVSTVFMGLGTTDINLLYFFLSIAIGLMIISRVQFDKLNKMSNILFSLLAFCILIGSLFMSASVVSYNIAPQYIDNQSAWDGIGNLTTSHIYNGSVMNITPQNSTTLSVIIIIITLFAFINFVELLVSLFEMNKNAKMEVKGL